MLRKGDPGADRPDASAGKITKQNTELNNDQIKDQIKEILLSEDEKARKFYDDMQKLRQNLHSLRGRNSLHVNAEAKEAAKEAVEASVVNDEPPVPAAPEISGESVQASATIEASVPVVERVPIEEPGPAVETAPAAPERLRESVETFAPIEEEVPAVESKPAAPERFEESIETPVPIEEPVPIVESAPTEAPAPIVESAPVEEPVPVVETQIEEPVPPVERVPEQETVLAEESTPEQETAPVSLETAPEEAAAQAFEAEFRQQMESQMQAVQSEKPRRITRSEERREERRARAKKKQKEKQKERELRAEVKRKKRLADKSAEMGGGIVNTHGIKVSTEVQPVAKFSWRDLLGIVPPSEKRAAASEEELQALKEEQERKTAEARATAAQLSKVRQTRYQNSALGRRTGAFKKFCERHKTLLLTGMSMVLLVCVGAAGVVNYCTAYEYSYNGHVLGYVKSKDQVLQITDMVQRALTEDKEMQVIIDAKDDISFQRVSLLDREVTPDSSDEVLRRLTYIGDLNVKAYGIYVNGDKVGAVESKEAAADVLKRIEKRYASDKKGTVIEKAEILETVDVKKSNTRLREVYTPKRMAELLCTSGQKETVHTVIAGETLDDIAEMYGTTEERLVADNEGVDPKKLEVGSTLLIRQKAPLLTVRMTEKRDYTQTIEYETVEKKTDEMYEDEQEIQQEGKDGSEDISERTVSINGEVEETDILKRVVTKKPVKKIVLIGTAERPPSVGDGVYIWPLEGGYTLTSNFGYRWGRLHAGIDLGTSVGNDVLAADGGIVVRAGYFGGYGYCVDIDHQNGQMTRYGHLSSILVNVGDEVYEGMHIAESGNTGRSTGPHLHFEIHNNGSPHDPLQDLP